jgi:hypothetical protein
MEALAAHKGSLGPVADEVSGAIAHQTYDLEESDLAGALALSLESQHQGAQDLRSKVLGDERLLADASRAATVLKSADLLGERFADEVGRALFNGARKEPEPTADALRELKVETAMTAIDKFAGLLAEHVAEGEITVSERERYGSMLERLRDGDAQRSIAQKFAEALLRTGDGDLVALTDAHLSQLSPVDLSSYAESLLEAAEDQPTGRVFTWIDAIDSSVVPDLGQATEQLDPVWAHAWHEVSSGALDRTTLEDALKTARQWVEAGQLALGEQARQAITSTLESPLGSEEQAQERVGMFRTAESFREAGLLDEATLGDAVVTMARGTFDQRVLSVTEVHANTVLDLVDRYSSTSSDEMLEAFLDAPNPGFWPGTSQSARLIASRQKDRGEVPLEAEEIVSLAGNPLFDRGLAAWLAMYAQEVDEVVDAVASIKHQVPSQPLADALSEHCRWWREKHPERHVEFIRRLVGGAPTERVSPEFLRAVQINDVPNRKLIDLFVDAGQRATDAQQSRSVIDLLSVVRIDHQAAYDHLLHGLIAPLARRGAAEDLQVAMERLDWLKKGSQSVRNATRRALRNAADAAGVRTELEEHMHRAKLSRKKGLFGMGGREDL